MATTETRRAVLEPRQHWSRGGWFGSQLGASLWMLLAGLLALPRAAVAGAIVLALFLALNALGTLLWSKRADLSPHAGLQLLFVAHGALGSAAIFALDRAGAWDSIQIGAHVRAGPSYLVLAAVTLALMLSAYLRIGRVAPEAPPPPR